VILSAQAHSQWGICPLKNPRQKILQFPRAFEGNAPVSASNFASPAINHPKAQVKELRNAWGIKVLLRFILNFSDLLSKSVTYGRGGFKNGLI